MNHDWAPIIVTSAKWRCRCTQTSIPKNSISVLPDKMQTLSDLQHDGPDVDQSREPFALGPLSPLQTIKSKASVGRKPRPVLFHNPSMLAATFANAVTALTDDVEDLIARHGDDSLFDVFQRIFPDVRDVRRGLTSSHFSRL